jgi:hypothetical protein
MCIAVAFGAQAAVAAGAPPWVRPTAERTAQLWFGAKPVRLDAVDLEHRIAVIATFPAEVRCGSCSRPPGAAGMRGRIFRFSLDRKTHSAWHGSTLAIRRCASRPACYDGAPHTTLHEAVSGRGVLRDVLDGRLDRVWSCASLRAALDRAPKDLVRSKAIEMLHAATVKRAA